MDTETLNNEELLRRLYRLEWLLRYDHLIRYQDRGPMGNVHRGQGRILALLKLKPDMSQRELAGILDIRNQSLGELLAKLERAGLITRLPDESDRRVMNIHLTEEGRAAAESADGTDPQDDLFDALGEEERGAFGQALGKLIERLEARLGEARDFDPRGGFGRRGGRGPWGPDGRPGGLRGDPRGFPRGDPRGDPRRWRGSPYEGPFERAR